MVAKLLCKFMDSKILSLLDVICRWIFYVSYYGPLRTWVPPNTFLSSKFPWFLWFLHTSWVNILTCTTHTPNYTLQFSCFHLTPNVALCCLLKIIVLHIFNVQSWHEAYENLKQPYPLPKPLNLISLLPFNGTHQDDVVIWSMQFILDIYFL